MKTYFKRISAFLLTVIMVLGLCTTSLAEGTASITVNGLTANDNTVVKIYKVVSFNAAESKWDIAAWAKDSVTDTSDPYAFAWDNLKTAAASQTPDGMQNVSGTSCTFSGLDIGAYLIIATGTDTTYEVMGAATYEYDGDNLIGPKAVTLSAKGEEYKVKKDYDENSLVKDFAKTGDEIQYTITTSFPSYKDGETNRSFTITDTPTGMKVTEVTSVVVRENTLSESSDYTVSELGVADQAVTISFSSAFIGTENTYAGQSVTVSLKAVVTDADTFTNKANSDKDANGETVPGDVGSITIHKKDEDGDALKGAKFEITLDEEENPLFFVLVEAGVYQLKTDDVQGVAVTEVEATDGTVVLKGLGAGTYHIEETVAPEGYSINDNIEDVSLSAPDSKDVTLTVTDTRLAALPSTGGIGTTIFTIAGCAIMIAAAGIFFVSRRKTER